jgi:integrase
MRRPERIRLKDGSTRWQLRYEDAHRVIRYERFATRRAADAASARYENARKSGSAVDDKLRFDQLAAEFHIARVANGLRPSAKKDIETQLTRLSSHFGQRLLRTITPPGIEAFRNTTLEAMQRERRARVQRIIDRRTVERASLRAAKRDTAPVDAAIEKLTTALANIDGTRTINKCLGTLRTVLKFAEGRRYVAFNAATHVRMLKPRARDDVPIDHACLTPAEINALIQATDPDWRAAMSVLSYGGLRLGELLGLQWADVKFISNRILVRRQLEAVTGEFRQPKTQAGTRFVELPSFTMSELKTWKVRCPKGEFDLCFPDSRGGAMDDRNFRTRAFYPALRRATLRRIRVHDLRHTAASLMIATGADLAAISRQLGHANVQITLSVYTHFFAKRSDTGLGAKLEALVAKEIGCVLVVPTSAAEVQHSEVIELVMARGGIEPPTRGFSVRCSTN